ncbi:RES family NAD+ phosphorylase [Paeniglutamicibacter gangotriensis]|uniref:RES domain protein n=1 Tax=Paeniglutamicibacter gangotriensis Lz1y TaxID=1276920 RepID=M7NDF6_9MICC|nr:RES family NAD+ phosphorylase [Paeniglutamicibacter gangotriensis]EMQ99839.1 RES domain protein [Paeniglutamicibacter gangotriensis Lz1y]
MTGGFPPQDLQCPDPAGCTVAISQLGSLATTGGLLHVSFPTSRHWYRVYDARDGYGHPNPGFGDTRFSPFDSLGTGERVPSFYLAQSLEAALLETSLHDVHVRRPRVVSELSLLGKLHARVVPPGPLDLIDLRDMQLEALGLVRENVASSSTEHYPCTRKVARTIHASYPASSGILWHSRQAEISGIRHQEVAMVFGDRVPLHRGAWTLGPYRNASGSLLEGTGRLLLDELAEALDVTISVSDDLP